MTLTPAPDLHHNVAPAAWPCVDASLNLLPSTEERDFREALRALLDSQGDIESVRTLTSGTPGYSIPLWSELTQSMAVTSVAADEEAGGEGFGTTFLAAALEECGRALRPEPVLGSATVGTVALALGSTKDTEDWQRAALTGALIVSSSRLTAATDRIDAVCDGGTWAVHGAAYPVTSAAAADVFIVTAATGDGRGLYAVSAADARVRTHDSIDPTRPVATVRFDAAPAQLLTESAGEIAMLHTRLRLALSAELVGIAERLLELTREYTLSRRQFGRQIASFQAVKHRLADMLLNVERARSLTRYATVHFDHDRDTGALPAAAAAAMAMDAAHDIASETIQLHGGIGFTWEHPAHSYYRRVLANEGAYGSASEHRAAVARILVPASG